MTRRFASGPLIAQLLSCSRMTANERLRAGRYGRTYRIGRIVYADLAEVTRAEGCDFSEEQLERASAGLPDRILIAAKEIA